VAWGSLLPALSRLLVVVGYEAAGDLSPRSPLLCSLLFLFLFLIPETSKISGGG
jgi:hypothetical protein